MPSLCCFLCPEHHEGNRSYNDVCPTCGQPYGFPLYSSPETVGDYRIIKPLHRGFYSATYLAEWGPLNKKRVLKIVPQAVYRFFKKDFISECELHSNVASDSEHIVDIDTYFDHEVTFGKTVLPCHIAVLEYVGGEPLDTLLNSSKPISAFKVAQIAIDLFRILRDLQSKNIYHNDLHSRNIIIQELPENSKRAEAIDERIRAVAIDLGSLSSASGSNGQTKVGDVHRVAKYLNRFSEKLLESPDKVADLEYRLGYLLKDRAQLLFPRIPMQRLPTFDDCIKDIRNAFNQIESPWRETLKLTKFNDAFNAQTLAPWFVPLLIVDPDGKWLPQISSRGPQVVTGMRGCGKTMFLRALQFHARAIPQDGLEERDKSKLLQRLKTEGYIGLYASCTRLLEEPGVTEERFHEPFSKLFASYALEALRALRHLREIYKEGVSTVCYRELGDALANHLTGSSFLKSVGSDYELERAILKINVSLDSGHAKYKFKGPPSEAFRDLAHSIKSFSNLWSNHYVLFLLDDLSTRYLSKPKIEHLLSSLMFQGDICAFKITTEVQTLEMLLRSPGNIEKAQVGRDYDVFDLGAEVYNTIRKRREGKSFVENILLRRAKYYSAHPSPPPSKILGDISLKAIAQNICNTSKTSARKKAIYHGLSALAGVCVGDIGDVITLYDLILKKADGNTYPISARIQSECYQDLCSRRLYDLNRRQSGLKDFVLSFAEASHELLLKSCKASSDRPQRLRQYLSLYVRITTGDVEQQFKRLRELIDAGVFVFSGGSDTPRTKTRDSNPLQQFKLTYRKLFGLSNYIGLSERDRFEPPGDQLERWLNNPCKEILLQSPVIVTEADEAEDHDLEEASGEEFGIQPEEKKGPISYTEPLAPIHKQTSFYESIAPSTLTVTPVHDKIPVDLGELLDDRIPCVDQLYFEEIKHQQIDLIIMGLGFEERSLASAERLLEIIRPRAAILIRYQEKGKSREIKKLVKSVVANTHIIDYQQVLKRRIRSPDRRVLIDVTGLARPVLFDSIRKVLTARGEVWVCHTKAERYYPLNDDIGPVIEAERNQDHYSLLKNLASVIQGEQGPYVKHGLLDSDADESRRRVLCAFSSPKHERLFAILDSRDCDYIELIVPRPDSPRGKLAHLVAEIAARNFNYASLTTFDSNDLLGVLKFIAQRYHYWYVKHGFNFELALTGSKRQAVACAAVSAAFKISQCWYVQPQQFDTNRFTQGVGESSYFKISLSKGPSFEGE